MKKLFLVTFMLGLALVSFAQKPTINLTLSVNSYMNTITINSSQPVKDALDITVQYQAPDYATGYACFCNLIPVGTTSATITVAEIVDSNDVADFYEIYIGGHSYNANMTSTIETPNAIYNFIF